MDGSYSRRPHRALAGALVLALVVLLGGVSTIFSPARAQAWPAGAVSIGSSAYYIPPTAIFVAPTGNDASAGTSNAPKRTVSAAIAQAAAGQTIVLRGGSYHESVNIPTSKPGLTIQAYPHEPVWFDGTSAVTGFTQSSNVWVRSNWNVQFSHNASFAKGQYPSGQSPFVGSQNPMAAWPDAVWIDNVQQRQVASRAQVTAGTFFVDYGNRQLVLGSNPNGHAVRASDLQIAIMSLAERVTLQGFGVRRYATSMEQLAAVRLQRPLNTLRDLVVTENATQGVSVISSHALLDRVTASYNGMTGIHGNLADGVIIRSSLIQGNNAQQFNTSPSAAGIKLTKTRGVTAYGNVFTGNQANGLWLDESTVGFTIVNNRFTNNYVGAEVELSDTGVFANNVVSGGKFGFYIFNTGNVQVYNNSFSAFTDGGVFMTQNARRQANPGDAGHDPRYPPGDPTNPWLTRNISILNNTFGPAPAAKLQVYAIDRSTHVPADKMIQTINGNQFAMTPAIVGWGGSDNYTITLYRTPAALAAAKNSSWRNLQVATPTITGTTAANALAVTVPLGILSKIGVAAGSRQTGPFLSQVPG